MLNQIKQTAFCYIFLLLTFACQSIGKKSQVTIQSKSVDAHQMFQNNKFGDKQADNLSQNTPLSKTDHFPMFYTFLVNHKVRAMYVRPKNKVVTVYDRLNSAGLDRIDSLDFVGVSYPDENIILQEINRRFSVFQGYTLGLYKRSHDLKDAYMSSKRIYVEEQAYMKQAFKQYKTGRKFRNALNRETRYSYICNLIGPFSKSGTNVDSISTEYIEQVNSLKKELRNIIKTRSGTDKNVHETVYDFNRFLSRKAMKTDSAFDYQWLMAEQNFTGETREFLKFRLLKENYGAIPNYAFYYDQFKKTCKDKDFVAYLDNWATKNDHVFNPLELAATLSDSTGQNLSWSDVLSKYKGKKIYLMVSDFPIFQFMEKLYANRIPIFEQNNTQLIFLSTNKSKEDWQKTLQMDEAKPFQHYHLAKEDTALLNFLKPTGEGFKMSSNILIDENGKVILTNAADMNQMDMLQRQLKVVKKVIMP